MRGGSYVEGEIGLPVSFNPLLASSQSEQDLAQVLFRGLTWVDGSGQAQPDIAESWAVGDDGRSYTFTLRDGVTWHDGQPVTSQDVRFTVSLVQDPDFPGDPSLARFWRGIVVDTPDNRTVRFHLLDPFAAFPNYASLPILPKHILGGVLARDLGESAFNTDPVGTGPFKFESFDRSGQTVTLRAFDDYDGDKAYLSRLTFRYFLNNDELLAAMKNGAIDGTGALPIGQMLQPGALSKNVTVYAPEMFGFTALFFNLRNPLFSNLEVRRAIELGIDRGAILNGILETQAVPGTGPIPASSWAYSSSSPASDPKQAEQVLAKAGWTDSNGDGVLDNGSNRLSFALLVNADDPRRVAVASEIARQLAQLKIQVEVQSVSSADVSQALASRQFAAAVFGWHASSGDPDEYQLWHSSQASDGLNFTGLQSAAIDGTLADARRATDHDARMSLYATFQEQFAGQVPAVVLYYPRYYYVMSSKIQGVSASPVITPSDRFHSATHWYRIDGWGTPTG